MEFNYPIGHIAQADTSFKIVGQSWHSNATLGNDGTPYRVVLSMNSSQNYVGHQVYWDSIPPSLQQVGIPIAPFSQVVVTEDT